MDGGRIGIAAQALGIAQGAIDETVKYVQQRIQFNKRISQFQNTQFELADMQAKTDGARFLVYRAACAKDDHEPYNYLAATAKLVASEVQVILQEDAFSYLVDMVTQGTTQWKE